MAAGVRGKRDLSFSLKITLLGVKPAVWRRVVVPGEITLDRLHDVLQIVMGWEDRHLHTFKIGGKAYSEDPEEDWEGQDEWGRRLGALVTAAAPTFEYVYDFGDNWHHRVEVEAISQAPMGFKALTRCLGGKRRCPPEDVGGSFGYGAFLAALKKPKHPAHKEYLDWIGGSFDPAAFDMQAVNLELLRYARWSRPRATQLELEVGIE